MSEGTSGIGLLDSRHFIYLPGWVKVAILVTAVLMLGLAGFSTFEALRSHAHSDHVAFYLTVAQSGALALIFAVIVIFSRRDANVQQLLFLTDEFLKKYVADALQRVSVPDLGISKFDVSDEGQKDIFGRLLRMSAPGFTFRVWIGLNVNRLFVIYFIPLSAEVDAAKLREVFRFTFGGAEKVGFHANYEEAESNGERFVSIWLTAETTSDLLTSPHGKLFWSQDIAMMTESLLRTGIRNNIPLTTATVTPGPL